jgi:hypothetical protein
MEKPKYSIGQTAYLITDPDQHPRLVSGILIRQKTIIYYLVCGTEETAHYDYEISLEKTLSYAFN